MCSGTGRHASRAQRTHTCCTEPASRSSHAMVFIRMHRNGMLRLALGPLMSASERAELCSACCHGASDSVRRRFVSLSVVVCGFVFVVECVPADLVPSPLQQFNVSCHRQHSRSAASSSVEEHHQGAAHLVEQLRCLADAARDVGPVRSLPHQNQEVSHTLRQDS